MIDTTVATFGRLDAAFNDAGIQVPAHDAADEPAQVYDRVNAVNARGFWACMKHELRQMRGQGSGTIVNCSAPMSCSCTWLGRSKSRPMGVTGLWSLRIAGSPTQVMYVQCCL